MLNASTAYQTLPIVEDAFLKDNSAFVFYILEMTFGEKTRSHIIYVTIVRQRKISESWARSTRIRVCLKTEIFFSVFKGKNYPSTFSVFESFSVIHMKTLKRRKDDSIPYGACVMLEEHDV